MIEMLTKRYQNHRDREKRKKREKRENRAKDIHSHFGSIGFEGNSNNKEIKYAIK